MLRASSLGSNTSCTSPSRTVAPGASGASPFTCSPSTNVPLVESRSTSTHTPSRRCSLAWLVDTDGSGTTRDRKSTRLNSSHGYISYAVFCLKKKKNPKTIATELNQQQQP